MVESSPWNRLTDTVRERLILCSDFTATGRTVATFADLSRACPAGLAWWETNPPRPDQAPEYDTDAYLRRWAEDQPDGQVLAVAGFCVGAVFAAPIYHSVAARQEQPPLLLLFDPERPNPHLLLRHFRELLLGMRQYLDAAELAQVEDYCVRAPLSAPMPELAGQLSDWFAEIAVGALRRVGLDEEHSGQVAATFRSFISYLAMASAIDPRSAWRAGVAFSSAGAHSGLNSLPPADREAAVAVEQRFDLDHTTLLSDPGVAAAVAALLDPVDRPAVNR